MKKQDYFSKELACIKDDNIRQFAAGMLEKLPDYFFTVPASSTGKYHPSYALGEGGLVRHTQAAVRIAMELFRVDMFKYTEQEKDIIIASLILHDGCKSGLSHGKYTVVDHPLIMSNFISECAKKECCIDEPVLNLIKNCIETHMGQWTRDYKSNIEVLQPPKTKMQKFVHICDYLASRKCLEFNFDGPISNK